MADCLILDFAVLAINDVLIQLLATMIANLTKHYWLTCKEKRQNVLIKFVIYTSCVNYTLRKQLYVLKPTQTIYQLMYLLKRVESTLSIFDIIFLSQTTIPISSYLFLRCFLKRCANCYYSYNEFYGIRQTHFYL